MAIFSLLLGPCTTSAQIVITEIMYDLKSGADGGREWVEVYNSSAEAIDLAKLKLFENSTAHKITAVADAMLPPGAYAVIADNPGNFKTDWPQYNGLLFDSAFSLSNDGETIVLRNASGTPLDTAAYNSSLGAKGDGNTLNRSQSGGAFVARAPSPGFAMAVEAIVPIPKEPVKASNVAPEEKVVKKEVIKPLASTEEQAEEETTQNIEVAQVAAASVATEQMLRNSSLWWIGALVVASFAASALFLARRLSKTEWNIEEIEETG